MLERLPVLICCINPTQEGIDVYSTTEPMEAFNARINYCLKMHNEAVQAMRYPPNMPKVSFVFKTNDPLCVCVVQCRVCQREKETKKNNLFVVLLKKASAFAEDEDQLEKQKQEKELLEQSQDDEDEDEFWDVSCCQQNPQNLC